MLKKCKMDLTGLCVACVWDTLTHISWLCAVHVFHLQVARMSHVSRIKVSQLSNMRTSAYILNTYLRYAIYGIWLPANIHTHVHNAVPLVWGLLRLAPIMPIHFVVAAHCQELMSILNSSQVQMAINNIVYIYII